MKRKRRQNPNPSPTLKTARRIVGEHKTKTARAIAREQARKASLANGFALAGLGLVEIGAWIAERPVLVKAIAAMLAPDAAGARASRAHDDDRPLRVRRLQEASRDRRAGAFETRRHIARRTVCSHRCR